MTDKLKKIRHLALDLDGTLYLGGRSFEWTIPFLDTLKKLGIGHTYMTNNSSRATREYVEHLEKFGIHATSDEIFSSTHATLDHLLTERPKVKRLFILGTPALQVELSEHGFELCGLDPNDEPDAVIVGFDTTLSYPRVCHAAYWISKGKPFIATHCDRICPTDKPTVLPDCGAICAMLTAATGREPDSVLGKPDPRMISGIMHKHQLRADEIGMVGDRLYTDMAMARNAGAVGILVLSGETTAQQAKDANPPPDFVVNDVGELSTLLREMCNMIEQLKDEILDVLIIGGGIVGSGVARDAAMRGLRTGLVEQFDFAFGTSSRSSRLLHGGLRYLAQGRLGLVREASVEKVIISKIAPHLAAPLPFIFPTRSRGEWKRWKLRVGVKAYDLLCSGRNLGKSGALTPNETLRLLPELNPNQLSGAVRYYDGLTNDARLVLDTLRSAQASGAMLANYTPLKSAELRGDLWHCDLNGATVKAATVVNATGAWANRFPASGVKLRLTKGVHLVIDRSRLAIPEAVVMSEGSRILFAIPWGERVILGTTDTDYHGSPDSPGVDADDVRYILGVTNDTFSTARLAPSDVISAWSGVRPLIASGDQTGKPSDISRKHQIDMTQPGWIDVAGGKLTTYRLMAEQTVDEVVKLLGRSVPPSLTAHTPLLPDEPHPQFSGILPPKVSREAVEHFCKNEWAQHLGDVMIRRTSWRYYHPDHLAIAQQTAAWMSELLNWDATRMQLELAEYRGLVDQTRVAIVDANQPRPTAA